MKQYITLPGGNAVSLSTYVKAWKALRAMTADQRQAYQDFNWNWHSNNGNDILRAMRRGLHDRINARDCHFCRTEEVQKCDNLNVTSL